MFFGPFLQHFDYFLLNFDTFNNIFDNSRGFLKLFLQNFQQFKFFWTNFTINSSSFYKILDSFRDFLTSTMIFLTIFTIRDFYKIFYCFYSFLAISAMF